jgi:hypothetical protein
LSNSTEKGDGQKKFIDTLLEKKRSSGAISGVFWSCGVIYGDVLRYLVTPCLIPCEIVMHEMQIAAFMQSLPIVVGRCVGDRLELMIDRTCFHLAKSPSICTTLTRLPQCRNSQRNTCASDIPQKSIIYVQHVVILISPNGIMDAPARLRNFNGCQRQV